MYYSHIPPITQAKESELLYIETNLILKGYMISRPYGNDYIYISGHNRKYFNAKKKKADGLIEDMKRQGYTAFYTLSFDGYYDIKVTGLIKPEPQQTPNTLF